MSCFSAADESAHYGFSVAMLLEQYRAQLGWEHEGVVELGTGDATAIAEVVAGLPELRVRSFDISAPSVETARANIAARGLADRYTVELGDFFDSADSSGGPTVATVISNPPYIPAPDRDILMPELWGGFRGNDLLLQLLKAGYDNVIAAVASYADPGDTVRTAADLGYRVANFLAMGLDFGPYSNEPKVRAHIRRLCAEGRGWADENGYLVAVALLTRNPGIPGDRGAQLLRALGAAPA
ncbi:MAG TPA: methyltransferase [Blastococcus sp.]|nr:methyltransferase [Blastococcus sp.]